MAEHSNLPAPYESPWRQLARAVVAVLASLWLDLRAQRRRPLFWPLLLVALAVLLALGWALASAPHPATPVPPAPQAREQPLQQPRQLQQPLQEPLADRAAEVTSAAISRSAPEPAPRSEPQPQAAPRAEAMSTSPDPLLAELTLEGDPAAIQAVEVDADRSRLRLLLGADFRRLDPDRRATLADAWLQRCLKQGYEQLELVDPQGRLVGYRALVGSGMILLDADPTA